MKIPQKTIPLGLFSSSGDYLSDPAGSSRIPGWQSVVIVRKICIWYLGRELSIFIYQYMLFSHVHTRYRDMVESRIQKPKRKQSLSASQFLSISPLCFFSQKINMFSTTHVSSHFFLNFSFTMFFSQKDPIFLPKCSSKFNSTPPLPSCLGPTPNSLAEKFFEAQLGALPPRPLSWNHRVIGPCNRGVWTLYSRGHWLYI